MLVVTVFAIEAIAYSMYRVAMGEFFTYARVRDHQQTVAENSSDFSDLLQEVPQIVATTAIHPYMGFVYDADLWNKDGKSLRTHGLPVSEYGFVDDKSPIASQSPDRVVVAIFGGSVGMSLGIMGVEALFSELEKFEGFAGKEFVVVRVALGSHKQPQQFLTLGYLLALGARFDIVVNLDGFNEVALPPVRNLKNDVNPFFPRGWGDRLSRALDVRLVKLVGAKWLVEDERRSWAQTSRDSPLRHSVLASLIWSLRDRHLRSELARLAVEIQELESPGGDPTMESSGPNFEFKSEGELYRELVRVWREGSLQMNRLAQANGIAYYHFLQPNQYVKGSKLMLRGEVAMAIDPKQLYRHGAEMGYPHLRDAGRQLVGEGVSFHDLTMIFADVKRPIYIDTCCHMNVEGMERIGARIGETIRADLESRPVTEVGGRADSGSISHVELR